MNTENHALDNAESWMSSILEYVAAADLDYGRLDELRDQDRDQDEQAELESLIAAAGDNGDAEQARENLTESILDLQVRSGWHAPGEESESSEFIILLSTGGPALRIRGELSEYNQPERAWLEYQDWGTPWTEYLGHALDTEALLAFAGYFYFGE